MEFICILIISITINIIINNILIYRMMEWRKERRKKLIVGERERERERERKKESK